MREFSRFFISICALVLMGVFILLCVRMYDVINAGPHEAAVYDSYPANMAEGVVKAPEEAQEAAPAEGASEGGQEEAAEEETYYIEDMSVFPVGSVLLEERIDRTHPERYFLSYEIVEGDEVYQRIVNRSYVDNPDITLADLRYLKMLHYNYDGQVQIGEMIVNAVIAQDVLAVFHELFEARCQIASMHLIDDFWTGDALSTDDASIEANNTSAFCYRVIEGSQSLSRHAYGMAIDINPIENPYVYVGSDGSMWTDHERSNDYVYDRSAETPHVITQDSDIYNIMAASHGYAWGGDWNSPKDYQHFEK